MPPGQPTKYKPEYCKKVKEVLGAGGFNVTFCAEVGIHEDTFYEWIKVHEEFSEAVKEAAVLKKDWFLRKAQLCAFVPEDNPCNNGMAYLIAHNIGVRIKPEEKDTSDGVTELADALRDFAKNPSDK